MSINKVLYRCSSVLPGYISGFVQQTTFHREQSNALSLIRTDWQLHEKLLPNEILNGFCHRVTDKIQKEGEDSSRRRNGYVVIKYLSWTSWQGGEVYVGGEYWIVYRGPGFPVVRFCSSSPSSPQPPLKVSKLSLFLSLVIFRRVVGGGGAKSYNGEKAWYFINHSILSGWRCYLQQTFGHILNGKTTVYSRLFASCYLVFSKRININPIKALVLHLNI